MARFYSHYHSLATVIGKCIPKRGSGSYQTLFVHDIISGLKRLDAVQRNNPGVTLPFDVDGINVFCDGARVFRIMPAQKNLLIILANDEYTSIFDDAVENNIFKNSSRSRYRSWIVPQHSLFRLWEIVEALPKPKLDGKVISYKHPRYFSAAARLAAHEAFTRDGSICPGYGPRKRHEVETERIEYDHLIPYAKRGSSSERNIRIMCEACNRLKGAHVA